MELDEVDYAILTCLEQADGAKWKKDLHDCLLEYSDRLPGDIMVSVQTVGRRMDRLHDEALVQSCIASPDHLKRDLIIAYKLTEEGAAAAQELRVDKIREYTAAYHDVGDWSIDDEENQQLVLAHLIGAAFDLEEDKVAELSEQPFDQLVAYAHMFAIQRILTDLPDGSTGDVTAFAQAHVPEVVEAFNELVT